MTAVLVLFALALITFLYVARRIFYLHNNQFDNKVFAYLSHHVNEENNEIMLFLTFYGLLIYIVYNTFKNHLIKWTFITLLLLLILSIGFSRIYLKVHYASDVIAGCCVGLLWLVICVQLLNRMEKYSSNKLAPALHKPSVDAHIL